MKPGPTGKFPEGKLDETDEGELTIAVALYEGKVRIDFGKKIAWFAMSPQLATDIAHSLLSAARELRKKTH